ncbi:MAG: HAD-IA family hydrolase [Phycisphaerales bacterium]|nr:HAD-IA family hydrolase [Phycisphaerales bacterium]
MPAPALVILDCDGVLVDSERITTSLLAEVAAEAGWPMTDAQSITHFKGRDLHEVQRLIETRVGHVLGDGFIPDYRLRMARRFAERGVPAVAGARELLDWLDARAIPHAVASNAPHEKMRLTLGRIGVGPGQADGWFGRFEGRRFSAYDIQRWKPDPGLFLHAAAAMQEAPEACVVVEDSPSGVLAGIAAGMRVVALADLTPPADLAAAGATAIRASMPEVLRVLQEWTSEPAAGLLP